MKKFLALLVPVAVGAFATYSDQLVALVASNPKLSVVVGSLITAVAYVLKSPFVQAKIKEIEAGQ